MSPTRNYTNRAYSQVEGWGWFCVWGAVGAAAALGIVSLGPLALVPAILAAAILLRHREGRRRSAFGLLSGVGVILLIVAWVQRSGPGTTCWHTATSSGCEHHLNPIPWLIVGLGLLVAGVLAHRARERNKPDAT
jgi:hypothetical protein